MREANCDEQTLAYIAVFKKSLMVCLLGVTKVNKLNLKNLRKISDLEYQGLHSQHLCSSQLSNVHAKLEC